MTSALTPAGFEHVVASANDVALHAVVGGKGPLIVLLHGWPESWVTWRHVMKPLADAGFTVAALDLRGFGDSAKPSGVAAYRLTHVAADVDAFIQALGFDEAAAVVGHDWGGAVAWFMAQNLDEHVARFVILNSPHPAILARRLRTLEQLRASYYMFVFQVPKLAERLVAADDFRPIKNIFRHQPRRPGAYDDDDVAAAVAALKRPDALTCGLNYYRAAFREVVTGKAPRPKKPQAERPLLILWGLDDEALPEENLAGTDRFARDLRVIRIPSCSHWVQHDVPERFVQETVAFASK